MGLILLMPFPSLRTMQRYEEGFATIGMDALGRILEVVSTWRGETIRIISARKATRSERKYYEG
jgi:uncharacterized DUF497 family protein